MNRVHSLGWIDSKQLDSDGQLKPCTAPQCGGFTLEAELGIPKNSSGEPDFLGWEVKQYAVEDVERIESAKPITLMTPGPDGEKNFDTSPRPSPQEFVFPRRPSPGLRPPSPAPAGEGQRSRRRGRGNADVEGSAAASAAPVRAFANRPACPSRATAITRGARVLPYGHKVRLARGTDSLRLLRAFASGAMYYDPGIKLENASTDRPKHKMRSQFRVASKNIAALYEAVETVFV